jgi:hypothetical protein
MRPSKISTLKEINTQTCIYWVSFVYVFRVGKFLGDCLPRQAKVPCWYLKYQQHMAKFNYTILSKYFGKTVFFAGIEAVVSE